MKLIASLQCDQDWVDYAKECKIAEVEPLIHINYSSKYVDAASKCINAIKAVSSLNGSISIPATALAEPTVYSTLMTYCHSITSVEIRNYSPKLLHIDKIKALDSAVFFQVCSIRALSDLETFLPGINGVILKGNESGGFVAEESTFILFQHALKYLSNHSSLMIFVQGGIGIYTACTCTLMGASGIVLDDQCCLLERFPGRNRNKKTFTGLQASDTAVIKIDAYWQIRYLKRGLKDSDNPLKKLEFSFQENPYNLLSASDVSDLEYEALENTNSILYSGQAIGHAKLYSQSYQTISRLAKAFRQNLRRLQTLVGKDKQGRFSRFIDSYCCEVPVIQGPMTRVSDTPGFLRAVSDSGALPTFAVAMLRGDQLKSLMSQTHDMLGGKSWGAGLLGFVNREQYEEQVDIVKNAKPSFVIIAGGKPDQAREFQADNIPALLHAPTPELFSFYLQQKANAFILEGRECGGHIGPLSSFFLWESIVSLLCEKLSPSAETLSLVFAGGIYDESGSVFVRILTSFLQDYNIEVGMLCGTPYLFTPEAVRYGAINEKFQEIAINCQATTNLETGAGHSSRCVNTGFAFEFEHTKYKLRASNVDQSEISKKLNSLTLGRLRLATKGIRRNEAGDLTDATLQEQEDGGMYMIGQSATLTTHGFSMSELHANLATKSEHAFHNIKNNIAKESIENPVDIAIIGMSCLLPGCRNIDDYWQTILCKQSHIQVVPTERWDPELYYSDNRNDLDKTYSKWGGFMPTIEVDYQKHGIPPSSLKKIEPIQILTLELVQQALDNAGYPDGNYDCEKTCVILGAGGGVGEVGGQYATRAELPRRIGSLSSNDLDHLPVWGNETFPGVLLNVIAGRVSNRFNFSGPNYVTDAACASSLASLYAACNELSSRRSNLAITGGVDCGQSPFAYLCFSRSQALSPRGKSQAFDEKADGIVISEGIGILVLKRLDDAKADGDRIYAVIKAIQSSSDGRGNALTKPSSKGQRLALSRAADQAKLTNSVIELYEAHGTGTTLGDATELQSIKEHLLSLNVPSRSCAVTSVKPNIGHTKSTAGVAGVIKAALSLYYKTIPPHTGVDQPLPDLVNRDSPVYITNNPLPWFKQPNALRTAGISAFGFGGTNFHAVLAEDVDSATITKQPQCTNIWPTELICFSGSSLEQLKSQVDAAKDLAAESSASLFSEVIDSIWLSNANHEQTSLYRIAVVSSSVQDLINKLDAIILGFHEAILAQDAFKAIEHRADIYASSLDDGLSREASIVTIFPGQGSQNLGVYSSAFLHSGYFRDAYSLYLKSHPLRASHIHEVICLTGYESHADIESHQATIKSTVVAQPLLAIIHHALIRLLKDSGLQSTAYAGHSFGELSALYAGEAFDLTTYYELATIRSEYMSQACQIADTSMMATNATREKIDSLISGTDDIYISNINSPSQLVLGGRTESLDKLYKNLINTEFKAHRLNVEGAFHTPFMEEASKEYGKYLSQSTISAPNYNVFSNVSLSLFKDRSDILVNHSAQVSTQINFDQLVCNIIDSNPSTVFLDLGPGSTLAKLVSNITNSKTLECEIIALDTDQCALYCIQKLIAQLFVSGYLSRPRAMYEDRLTTALSEPQADCTGLSTNFKCYVNGAYAWLPNDSYYNSKLPQIQRQSDIYDGIKNPPNGVNSSYSPQVLNSQSVVNDSTLDRPYYDSINSNLSSPMDSRHKLAAYQSYQHTMQRFLLSQEKILSLMLNASIPVADKDSESLDANYSHLYLTQPVENEYVPPSIQPTQNPDLGQSSYLAASRIDINSFHDKTPAPANSQPSSLSNPIPSHGPVQEAVSTKESNLHGQPEESISLDQLEQTIKETISESTGYPIKALSNDADLEADLSIDSIKRVQVLSELQNKVPASLLSILKNNTDSFSKAISISEILDVFKQKYFGVKGDTLPGKY